MLILKKSGWDNKELYELVLGLAGQNSWIQMSTRDTKKLQWFKTTSDLEGSEPHEPVQPVVVRWDQAGPCGNISWFTLELVLLPHHLRGFRIWAQSSLEDDLGPLLSDAAPTWKQWQKVQQDQNHGNFTKTCWSHIIFTINTVKNTDVFRLLPWKFVQGQISLNIKSEDRRDIFLSLTTGRERE